MNIREQTQETQRQTLSPYASLSQHSRGRNVPVAECSIRTPYARDRDRIVHCKAFRRLMHKTQVFLSPEGDHYRTRLTHTLEVSQIARTLATALRLNGELAEAIALGHDLGHTPFGHAGERALREVSPGGFQHPQQSVRVVDKLENDGKGLNLTFEVRDGIGCHSYSNPAQHGAQTLEGRIVYFADKIAYLNHDLEDALRAQVLGENDIPWTIKYTLGRTKSERITALITSIVENSSGEAIAMDEKTAAAFSEFHKFMYDAVYLNPLAKGEEVKAQSMIQSLYTYFTDKPDEMPEEYRQIAQTEDVDRAVCDYISGMSDRYAMTTFVRLFMPKGWGY